MSCGIPVITSNIFGPAELGGNGAAHLVDPYKFEAIAEGMQKITTDPEYRNSLIEQGHKNLLKFSWESCGRETLAILEKTANI